MAESLAAKALAQWQKRSRQWLGRLAGSVAERHELAGEVAFLLEPDLKGGRGGLRDVHALHWAQRAGATLPAGDDRSFKLMIDPRFGARNVTQFVGSIERSRAPFHTHTYEEVIYILSGRGLVHVHGRSVPVREGSSVFLPPGVPHCLENASEGVLRLLGVFSPAGSPADKAEE